MVKLNENYASILMSIIDSPNTIFVEARDIFCKI